MEPPPRRLVAAFNVTDMRAEPDARAEMVSQALFGETVIEVRQWGDWVRIETPDGYAGWAPAGRFTALREGEVYPVPALAGVVSALFAPITAEPHGAARGITLLTVGSAVEMAGPVLDQHVPIRLPGRDVAYARAADVAPALPGTRRPEGLVGWARRFAGVPYLWGGRSPFGIDCSGFTQRVYALCGVTLPRDAYVQARSRLLSPVESADLQPGDLVFFKGDSDPRGRGITHVGLYAGEGLFIHAQGALGVVEMPLGADPYPRQLVRAARLSDAAAPR